jgi:hypothetical protein
MLRRLFLTFLLLLAAPAWAVPAMWQVGQGKRQITLYGTIHALPKGTDWLTPQAARAFNRAIFAHGFAHGFYFGRAFLHKFRCGGHSSVYFLF